MRIASKATKGKGKRWKRGTSSSCNPNSNTHRLRAKCWPSINGSYGAQPFGLPFGANSDVNTDVTPLGSQSICEDNIRLERLNLNESISVNHDNHCDDNHSVVSDIESEGKQSFASVWSNCSNVSFNKLLQGFQWSSAMHKQMLTVLSTVAHTIQTNGGKETETEYFAALMTCLQTVDNDETLTAVISLLQMVCKRLPPPIIRLRFSQTCEVFVEYLAKYMNGENSTLVRSLCNCLGIFLRHQELAVWQLSQTQHIFLTVLMLTVSNKPRIRKTARNVVINILKFNVNAGNRFVCHPVSKLTADFCVRKIEEIDVNDNLVTTLHILGLLRDILSVVPLSSVKKCCETILSLMTLGNALILSSSFKAFYTLFAAKPYEEVLSPELNAKLISALYDYQPNINDAQLINSWFVTIKEAFINLYRINKQMCFNHLPKFFTLSIGCWLSNSKQVHSCLAETLKDIYTNCIEPSAKQIDTKSIEVLFTCLQNALKYQYSNALVSVLNVISHYFNNDFKDLTINIISKLYDMRENNVELIGEIDFTFKRAVQVFGPIFVVDICNIKLNDDCSDLTCNWLLPILRDNVREAPLNFFIDYFIPLAIELESKVKAYELDKNKIKSKTCSILISQLWSLLPSFCIKPIDFDIAFKRIAKDLGSSLSNNYHRKYIIIALTNILKNSEDIASKQELSRFSKNFIPILMNIYTTEIKTDNEKNERSSIYSLMKLFFSISENTLLQSLYAKVKQRYQECDGNNILKALLLDIIRAFVPYVEVVDIEEMFTFIIMPSLNDDKQMTIQKKAYRLIEAICSSESDCCLQFINDNVLYIHDLLLKSFSKCLPPSKSYLLNTFRFIFNKGLNDKIKDFKNACDELLLKSLECLLLRSQKIKTSAYELIKTLSNFYNTNESQCEFMQLLLSLLNDSKYPTNAVLMALNRLYEDYRNCIPKSIERNIIDNIVSNLQSNSRQIIHECIEFLKYFLRTASIDQLSLYLENIIINLANIQLKHKNHFRVKVKELFVRLVRKYGYSTIVKMIPQTYSKVLKNIRKVEDRKKRKSKKGSILSDSDIKTKKPNEMQDIIRDSDDNSDDDQNYTKSISKQNMSWIKEDMKDGSDVLDLLSSKANNYILSENPEKNSTQSKASFSTSNDGKLIIEDIVEKRGIKRSVDEEEDNDIQSVVISETSKFSKRSSKMSGYKHGGKGIHRPINQEWGQEYKSNKARGDMKKKGKPDPYAYIPMNNKSLNKRKRAKLSGQFNSIVRSARKGAIKGSNFKLKRKN